MTRIRPESCPLCGSTRLILTHETESVWLWRCQRCGLQWPTIATERVGDVVTPKTPDQKP